jgi:hypothetical protein
MSTTDTFPIDADYAVTRTKESNVLRAKLDSAREYFRQKAPPRRIFTLVFNQRSAADWHTIEQFRLKLMTDFFTWTDVSEGRSYSVYFDVEPIYEEVGNEQVNIKLQLIEAVGAAMATYPSFDAGNPFVTVPLASFVNLGSNGYQYVYAGYGYRINGDFSAEYVDEVLLGGNPNPAIAIPLGLHRLRIIPTGPGFDHIDYLV